MYGESTSLNPLTYVGNYRMGLVVTHTVVAIVNGF